MPLNDGTASNYLDMVNSMPDHFESCCATPIDSVTSDAYDILSHDVTFVITEAIQFGSSNRNYATNLIRVLMEF